VDRLKTERVGQPAWDVLVEGALERSARLAVDDLP
jgi:hypothetical protein